MMRGLPLALALSIASWVIIFEVVMVIRDEASDLAPPTDLLEDLADLTPALIVNVIL